VAEGQMDKRNTQMKAVRCTNKYIKRYIHGQYLLRAGIGRWLHGNKWKRSTLRGQPIVTGHSNPQNVAKYSRY